MAFVDKIGKNDVHERWLTVLETKLSAAYLFLKLVCIFYQF